MNKSAYRFYRATLTPGKVLTISSYARFLTILSNNLTTSPKISINGDAEEELPSGLSVELPEKENFDHLELRNPSAIDSMTLEFSLSAGHIYDNRLVISGSTFTEILDQLKGDSVPENWGNDITVGVVAVSLLAANTNRKSVLIQSDVANSGIIYIGYDNTVGSGKKVATLLPGSSFSVDDYTGQIYAISGVAGQKVSASEV